MDTLTHGLSGALVARAVTPRRAGPGIPDPGTSGWVGFWAAVFPDIDVLLRLYDPLVYLNVHRGETHSLILLPVWAVLLGLVFHYVYRRRYRLAPLVGLSALGVAIHIAGDVITAYGTMILRPLSDLSVALDTTFIIDPWFSGIIVAGLVASWWWQSRFAAAAGVAVLICYVAGQGVLNQQATALAEAKRVALDRPDMAVRAVPQPLSPFNWKVLVIGEGEYWQAHVNLLRRSVWEHDEGFWLWRVHARFRPPEDPGWAPWYLFPSGPEGEEVASAWDSEALELYRRFAAYPVLYRHDRTGNETCVWFTDLRFYTPSLTPPFRYGVCEDPQDGSWRLHRLDWRDDAPRAL